MRWYDVLVLCLIAAYCVYVLLRKNKCGCSGNCENCKGCNHKENQLK